MLVRLLLECATCCSMFSLLRLYLFVERDCDISSIDLLTEKDCHWDFLAVSYVCKPAETGKAMCVTENPIHILRRFR